MNDTIELALAAVEAVLPDGWRPSIMPYWPQGWEAEAHDITKVYRPGRGKYSTGTTGPFATIAEALRALAVLVRDHR